ncbi:MAG: four helix bundle protein [Acidobacteria bacterium]|nr:MAG: four helix bundle protein [Acidobacteriota bacterium]
MSESKPDANEPSLDFERLDVYRLACEFQSLAFRAAARAGTVCRNELERASLSIVLNIAEGAGRRSAPEKARYYVIARGSATESAALLDVLARDGRISVSDVRAGRAQIIRIVHMLSRLVARWTGAGVA